MYMVPLPVSADLHTRGDAAAPRDGTTHCFCSDTSGFGMKPGMGLWETGRQCPILSLCLCGLSLSLHLISPALLSAGQGFLNMLLLQKIFKPAAY